MKYSNATTQAREMLSALADGQLDDADYAIALKACEQDVTLIAEWDAYHLIGNVLRSSAPAASGADLAFADRVSRRITSGSSADWTLLTTDPVVPSRPISHEKPLPQFEQRYSAANDGNFRWKMVAGLASLAAVGAIAFSTFGSLTRADAPQLAFDAGTEQILVSSPQGPVFRDPRLDELLADHRQLGSASVLQMPSGFLRNAAFEVPQNGGR